VIRSDCDGEFYGKYHRSGRYSGPFVSFLEECGIVLQHTVPGIPHQNGVAERRNRTLKNMVRSMIAYTILPMTLWSEAL